ncbi:alpha/beta hydrolase family protein [Changpingibacter yushuensis]|uniref:alpha/beta hydrolase family protein n=1 Tax=Changpingibacter yushuensis TaxID=2758440 RepID=UPI0015F61D4E|nr:acyl-CoA thioester hydrolase/BAAT C-terminal domain-containing protein [Changpingibacter yushuensis]
MTEREEDVVISSDQFTDTGAEASVAGKSRNGIQRFALTHPRLSLWIVFVLALGLWGSWAGPGWNPQPMRSLIVPEASDTSITTSIDTADVGTYAVESTVVTITLRDGTDIPATLRAPIGFDGLAPGMLFIHGTGTSSYRSFTEEATDIASAGIVTLVPEKRTDDYTATHRDYEELALDFEDAFEYLVNQAGVDPHRSGLYGVSEGCFIAPIVATARDDVSLVVLVSAPVLPIREQGALAADTYLRNLGVPDRLLQAIPRLIGQDFGSGTFDYIDFDVSTYQRQMTMPILMLYGTGDMSMPTIQGPLILRDDLAEAGNTDLTLRYYDGADHGLKVDKVLDRNAMQDIADWVNDLPFTADASPRVAGAQPNQSYVASTPGRPHWFASGTTAIAILAIGLIATVITIPLSALSFVRRKGRRPFDLRGCGGQLNIASLGVLLSVVVAAGYVMAVAELALSYQQNKIVVQGGWLIAEIVALLAAWLVVRFAFKCWREYRRCRESDEGRMSRAASAIQIFAILGQVTLLLAVAYWGFFPSIM